MVNYKLFCLVFISILLVGTISAFEIDNVKDTFKVTKDVPITIGDKQIDYNPLWEKYKPITIENAFGLPLIGSTLFTGAIDEHTETCGLKCLSTIDIYLENNGSLIDDITFRYFSLFSLLSNAFRKSVSPFFTKLFDIKNTSKLTGDSLPTLIIGSLLISLI